MYQFLELPNLEKYYSENPNSIIFAFLAFRNLEQGNVEKALTICEQGVRKFPKYPFGHFVLGLCYYHLKDFARGKTHLEISTAYDDKNPKAWKLLGEINEKLDLSLLAEECNLNYYLLDSFNTDALEKYQKEELIDFNAFRSDFSPKDMPPTEVKDDSEIQEGESELGSFFSTPGEEDDGLDLSEVTKAKFEESLAEISAAQDDEELKPEHSKTSDQTANDWTNEDEGAQLAMEEAPQASEPDQAEEPDAFDDGASLADEESDIFDTTDESELSPGQSDDLLDFKSVVKDIISENKEDTAETLEEKTEHSRNAEEPVESDENNETVEGDMAADRSPMLTPTLGEIYIAQGRFGEAIGVFEQLLKKEPDNNRYQKKITDIKAIIDKQKLNPPGD